MWKYKRLSSPRYRPLKPCFIQYTTLPCSVRYHWTWVHFLVSLKARTLPNVHTYIASTVVRAWDDDTAILHRFSHAPRSKPLQTRLYASDVSTDVCLGLPHVRIYSTAQYLVLVLLLLLLLLLPCECGRNVTQDDAMAMPAPAPRSRLSIGTPADASDMSPMDTGDAIDFGALAAGLDSGTGDDGR